ncbi:NADAR family protein [Estrella lausannensis]|uniref:NADAR domain-containing protein n=1 Tax=Estrella lausannensis TaxID=483423 RepID=A0A0H5E824_9BACT|nr:NADAR family protein [Estrella lausannensis]CRX39500.1 conserved hypothetical protein [Estrella lausannensis]
MHVSFFTDRPFSVDYRSRIQPLDASDIKKIIIATVAGALFFLIGSLFAFFGASYYFRTKKIEQLAAADDPHLRKVEKVKNQRIGNQHLALLSQVRKIATKYNEAIGTYLVCFYKHGPTEFLGNFAHCRLGVRVFENTFQCSEAAFQWRKYYLAAVEHARDDLMNDPRMKEFFSANGEKAYRINQELRKQYHGIVPVGWRTGVRDLVMQSVLEAKFEQNPELKQLLDATKGAYLLEHNEAARDDYWSDNSNGTGKNMLGKMLMALRDGTPYPQVDDLSGATQVVKYALWANQEGALDYPIF